jgi:hypothetical protein
VKLHNLNCLHNIYLAGKTRYLKNEAQQLGSLAATLSIKVAALKKVVLSICIMYPALIEQLGEQINGSPI